MKEGRKEGRKEEKENRKEKVRNIERDKIAWVSKGVGVCGGLGARK